MKNILELLENDALLWPEKTAFLDDASGITYGKLLDSAKRVGTGLLALRIRGKPIAVYMEKSVETLIAMLGIVYSGNIYTVIDTDMPPERIRSIFKTLRPAAIITDSNHAEPAMEFSTPVFFLDALRQTVIDTPALNVVREKQVDTDPLYILYTSGSTGLPKGTVIHHRNVLAYSEWFVRAFEIDQKTVIANQSPFYFSMSVTDLYATLRAGATMVILPKICFTFPIQLMSYLNRFQVTMIYWVPSAFGIVANAKLFDYEKPRFLKKVLFAGEVMPVRYLNYWRDHLGSSVLFANLFGPTETTDICTYYIVDRRFDAHESLPIGRHCENCDVFLLNSSGKPAANGEVGELYVRGSFVSPGYYNDPERTAAVFVRNPLNSAYPERCYRTGDLVRMNDNGELLFLGRKDHQIKCMGYRIELGEIETAANAVNGVTESACIFSRAEDDIVLFYAAAGISESELAAVLKRKLPSYMLPNRLIRLASLPHNQNGKIDRIALEKRLQHGKTHHPY